MKLQSRFLLIYGLGGTVFLTISTMLVFFSMQNSMTGKLKTQFLSNAEIKYDKVHEAISDLTLHYQSYTRLPVFRLYRYHQLTLNKPAELDDLRQLTLFFHEEQRFNKNITRTQFINTAGLELFNIENQAIIKNHKDLSQNPAIQTALQLTEGKNRISLEPDANNPDQMIWWLPVYVANNIHLGVIAIHTDFNNIKELIRKQAKDSPERTCLYDENQTLLTASHNNETCNTGENNVWSYTKALKISSISWPLTIQTKQEHYLEDVIRLRWITFGIILPLIAAIAFLTILVTSRQITSSLKDIVQSARSLGSDNSYKPVKTGNTNELIELSDELNRTAKLIASRTNELIQSNSELESFSYTIAHDLRTPLRTIVGFSEILIKHVDGKLDSDSINHLDRIVSAAHKMSALIDKILELSRITRIESRHETVDLSKLSEQILKDLSMTDPERHIKWHIKHNLIVKGDPQLLKSLMENLLDNAWKYTKNCSNAEIHVYAIIQDNKKVYCVQDNGAGFDMKYVNKLFKPFERLHNKHDFDGTGVGLASAQRIISKHHGQIWAESQLNQGTTLYFTLN